MDKNMDYEDEIREWLYEQDDDVLVDYWNHYQIENCYEDEIYPMYDLQFHIEGMDKMDIIKEFAGNDKFDSTDDWFYIGIYGWSSFDKIDNKNSPFDYGDLSHYIDCNHDDYIFEEFMSDKMNEIDEFLEDDDEE